MELNRKPYQGVWNIVRFNLPFYVVAGMVILLVIGVAGYFSGLFFLFPAGCCFGSIRWNICFAAGISLYL